MSKSENTFEGQHDDESIILVFRRHPIVMRKGLLAVLLGITIGMLPSLIWPEPQNLWFILVGFLVGLPVFFIYWVRWYYSVFIVTDQRFIEVSQKGLFSRAVIDLSLDKIQSINYEVRGLQETLLGFGTIVIQALVGDMVIDQVYRPSKIQHDLAKIIKELGINSNIQGVDY